MWSHPMFVKQQLCTKGSILFMCILVQFRILTMKSSWISLILLMTGNAYIGYFLSSIRYNHLYESKNAYSYENTILKTIICFSIFYITKRARSICSFYLMPSSDFKHLNETYKTPNCANVRNNSLQRLQISQLRKPRWLLMRHRAISFYKVQQGVMHNAKQKPLATGSWKII